MLGLIFIAGPLVEVQELVTPSGAIGAPSMVPTDRPSGQNDVGIVAWLLTLKTPECPQGRQVPLFPARNALLVLMYDPGTEWTCEGTMLQTDCTEQLENSLVSLQLGAWQQDSASHLSLVDCKESHSAGRHMLLTCPQARDSLNGA